MLQQTKDARKRTLALGIAPFVGVALIGAASFASTKAARIRQIPVTFSGGHDTDPRDNGRPVILVASALGVPAQVFRQAFADVHPAPPGVQPTGDEQRANKAVLLSALAPYGVTNERLDQVSDHYRYQRSLGGMWPNTPATAYALLKGNKVIRYVVTSGGCGYTSNPSVIVPGFPNAAAVAHLSFGQNFSRNGSIASIAIVRAQRSIQLPVMDEPGSMMPPPPPPPPPHE